MNNMKQLLERIFVLFVLFFVSSIVYGTDSIPQAVNLRVTDLSYSQIKLSWNAPITDETVSAYNVYRDGKLVATVNDVAYTDNNVMKGNTYIYKVSVVPAQGTEFEPCPSVTVKTFEFYNFNNRLPVAQTENEDGTKIPDDTSAALMTGALSLRETLSAINGSPVGVDGKFDQLTAQLIQEEEKTYTDFQSGKLTPEENSALLASINPATPGDVYVNNQMLELARRYYNTGNTAKALALYEAALPSLSNYSASVAYVLDRIATIRLAALNNGMTVTESANVLADARSVYMRFFNVYFPADTAASAQFIHRAVAKMYFEHFPVLLSYNTYNATAFNNAKNAASALVGMNASIENQRLLSAISAWEKKSFEISSKQNATTALNGTVIIKNISADNGLSYLFPGAAYSDERSFTIKNGSCSIPVYAGHLYSFSFSFSIPGGVPLQYELPAIFWQGGVKQSYDYRNPGVSSDCPANRSMLEFMIPVPAYPYNLKCVRNIDTFDLSWSYVPATGFSFDHFKVYRGDAPIITVTEPAAVKIPLLNGDSVYTYKVIAYDASGNASPASNVIEVLPGDMTVYADYFAWIQKYFGDQTMYAADDPDNDGMNNYDEFLNGSDPTLPFAPDVGFTKIMLSYISMTWDPVPGSGVYYKVFRNGKQLGISINQSHVDAFLTPGGTYNYQVQAFNRKGKITDLSRGVKVKTFAPAIPKAHLASYKLLTAAFNTAKPDNYSGSALQSAVNSVANALFGTTISNAAADKQKLETLYNKELEKINTFRTKDSAPLTKEELSELYSLMDHYFGGTSYENIYIHARLLELGDTYYTDYLKDKSKTENLERAIALYQIAIDFRPNTEEGLFTTLRRLGDFIIEKYSSCQNDTERLAVLEEYRNTILAFTGAYPESESYLTKQLFGLVINANFSKFPELLKYANYNTGLFTNTVDAIEQALKKAPDKYLYNLRAKQVAAWQLMDLTVSGTVPDGAVRYPGKLIIKNISNTLTPSVIPAGTDFVDTREIPIGGNSVTIPVYAGHLYEVSAVFTIEGADPVIYNLGSVIFEPGKDNIFSHDGISTAENGNSSAAGLSFAAGRPEVPYNLNAKLKANDTFDLTWSWINTSGFTVDHFEIYQGGVLISESATTSITGLSRAYREDGEYSYKIRAVAPDNSTSGFSAALTVKPSDNNELLQYHNWSIKYFGKLVPQNEDADNDGLTNYQEFKLGSDPTVAPSDDSSSKPANAINGFKSYYYAGVFNELPDFSKLEAYKTDVLANFASTEGNVLSSGRNESFAAVFSGYIVITSPGTYRFYMQADDSARLYIDGVVVAESKTNKSVISNETQTDYPLMSGTHSIRIEYLQTAGNGSLGLAWGGPGLQRSNLDKSFVWHLENSDSALDEIIEWQKDSDFDGVRDLIEIQKRTDPLKADTDGDGLNDYEELYVYHTNPLLADTDGDGVSDLEESKYALSNPLTVDFNGNNAVTASISGKDASATTNTWEQAGDALRCTGHNGSATYSENIPQNGFYVVKLTAREGRYMLDNESSESHFTIKCLVNGVYTMTRTLETSNNLPNSMLFYLPELKTGKTDIKFVWSNISDNTFLQIDSVQVMTLGGPDANANSIADWIDNRLAKLNALTISSESKVSPLCVEGARNIADGIAISLKGKLGASNKTPWADGSEILWLDSTLPDESVSGYTQVTPEAIPAVGNAYYANVPLYPDGTTEIKVSAQNKDISTKEITWVRTNILEESTLTIRLGDSLKLAAYPDGAIRGNAVITVEGKNTNISESEAVVHRFDKAGTFTVSAEFVPVDGSAATTGTMSVKVVSAAFSGAPYVLLGFERTWVNANVPASVYLDYDSNLTVFRTAQGTGSKIVFYGSEIGDGRMLARISENGAILDGTTVSVIGCRTHREEGYYKVLDVFSDGTKLIEGKIILSDIPADLKITLYISTAGTTFLDGTVVKTLTAADFDENGVCRYQLLKAADSPTSTCHTIDFYQGGVKLFSYRN